MKIITILISSIIFFSLSSLTSAAPPILINVSSHAASISKEDGWSIHARIRKVVLKRDYIMVSQNRPRNWDSSLEENWGVILPTRDKHFVRSVSDTDPTITPENLYNHAVALLELNPRIIIVDEIASGTLASVEGFLAIAEANGNTELMQKLGFFIVANESRKYTSFGPNIHRFFLKWNSYVYAETYGGRIKQVRYKGRMRQNNKKVEPRLKGEAVKNYKRAGWNVRPMVSAKSVHIGTGKASKLNLRDRIRFIREHTGYIPAVWHVSSAHNRPTLGMGRMIVNELTEYLPWQQILPLRPDKPF